MAGKCRTAFFFLFLLVAAPASGEMESSEYEPTENLKQSAQDLERRKREIEAERQAEARRAEEERVAEEALRLARGAELAARPYSVRLLEARCTACHVRESFTHIRHSWLGWQAVILRMQYFNGARLNPGERGDLARHLAVAQPASLGEAALEYAMLLATLAAPFLGWAGWRRVCDIRQNRAAF